MANEGFIKLYRKMLEWGWYDDGPTKDVFIHLLLIASYEDKFYRGIPLERGQVVTTVKEMSVKLGLTTQQIRTALGKLISTNEVTKNATSKFTVYTINNYADYQAINKDSNNPATNEQQTSNKPSNTKKVRSKEIPPIPPTGVDADFPSFDRFWAAYPKKVGKADARKKFEKLVPDESTLSAILSSLEYLKATDQWQRENGKYIPNPSTWLNQKRWQDEASQSPTTVRSTDNLRPVFDREYTFEERMNGVVPKIVGWEEAKA